MTELEKLKIKKRGENYLREYGLHELYPQKQRDYILNALVKECDYRKIISEDESLVLATLEDVIGNVSDAIKEGKLAYIEPLDGSVYPPNYFQPKEYEQRWSVVWEDDGTILVFDDTFNETEYDEGEMVWSYIPEEEDKPEWLEKVPWGDDDALLVALSDNALIRAALTREFYVVYVDDDKKEEVAKQIENAALTPGEFQVDVAAPGQLTVWVESGNDNVDFSDVMSTLPTDLEIKWERLSIYRLAGLTDRDYSILHDENASEEEIFSFLKGIPKEEWEHPQKGDYVQGKGLPQYGFVISPAGSIGRGKIEGVLIDNVATGGQDFIPFSQVTILHRGLLTYEETTKMWEYANSPEYAKKATLSLSDEHLKSILNNILDFTDLKARDVAIEDGSLVGVIQALSNEVDLFHIEIKSSGKFSIKPAQHINDVINFFIHKKEE